MKNINDQIIEFINERDWDQFHTPKNLAIAIGAEVGELMECFQWKTDTELDRIIEQKDTVNFADEIADIYMYMISLCNSMNIDLEESVRNKIDKNKMKYPVSKSYGNAKKYTDL
ncbi:NTP pyrophosphatase (non-canonical NTP hydrolase) [Mobilisporobacter senegalensis]|uniref:NTP pyrophosphatase (Non-canonical NTP hydrolase) n=1 Tax=Mobilisporobacter senegalensis TaxID=1329262 RepID=A0A3N1XN76_9FIRM|nr:nucleotide pyrophosphohydrolase [Mobilisporobacter senegalensis]ROR28134.1 NTP pyrophosphatase (non-canonical NTP hydrolase) [Mobilisporobacter senegalensis]